VRPDEAIVVDALDDLELALHRVALREGAIALAQHGDVAGGVLHRAPLALCELVRLGRLRDVQVADRYRRGHDAHGRRDHERILDARPGLPGKGLEAETVGPGFLAAARQEIDFDHRNSVAVGGR
jgi:hypothetical protein